MTLNAKQTALLDCLAANYAAQCVLDNVHMNLDTPSVEFEAIEISTFNVELLVRDDLSIVETVNGDSFIYTSVAAYLDMLEEMFS